MTSPQPERKMASPASVRRYVNIGFAYPVLIGALLLAVWLVDLSLWVAALIFVVWAGLAAVYTMLPTWRANARS